MEKTPLIIILGLETTRTTQDTFDILDKFRSAYGSAIIEYYEVDIRNLSVMEYKLDSANYPTGITCGFRLAQVVFDIGNINGLSYVVARFINDTINTIRHKEYERSNYNGSFFIGNHSINDIIDDYDYDPAEHVGIYSTYPIGGCWYAYRGGDLCSCFDKLYTNSYLFAYGNSPHAVLDWIDEFNTPQNLYAANKTYYTIHLSEKVTGTVIDNTPIVYNGTTIGKTIYIEENRAIIDLDCIPVPYDSFDYFVRDVESFDAQYGYDGILRIIPKLKASVVKDTSPVELDILPWQEVGGVALVLIVINDDIVNDGIELQTANTINTYSLNIFGWLHDIRPTFRMFVNSDTIFNKSLDNIEFDSIVIIDAESSIVIDRALSLCSKEVRTLFNYSSDSYNFKYDYINTNSYEDKTYIVTRKENKEDDKSE